MMADPEGDNSVPFDMSLFDDLVEAMNTMIKIVNQPVSYEILLALTAKIVERPLTVQERLAVETALVVAVQMGSLELIDKTPSTVQELHSIAPGRCTVKNVRKVKKGKSSASKKSIYRKHGAVKPKIKPMSKRNKKDTDSDTYTDTDSDSDLDTEEDQEEEEEEDKK
ncbi:uncharacterized protein LOC111065347 [Drosophila obscura]|uniref:uncharacterized protein LOC111065347 n=1 Tax=Drosophila obscura TaxID=7282 RepID=UPI001BB175C5|nr:uncharacterized protein LOC111065347 [Drosophila obscura]